MNTNITVLGASKCEPECGATGAATGLRHVTVLERGTSEGTTIGTFGDTAEVCPSGGKWQGGILEPWSGLSGTSGLCAGTVPVPRRVTARKSGERAGETNVLVDDLSSKLARIRFVVVLDSRECGTVLHIPRGVRTVVDELLEQAEVRPAARVISLLKSLHLEYHTRS